MPTDDLAVDDVSWDDPTASMLRDEQTAEIRELYGPDGMEPGPAPTGDDVVVFLVARTSDGEPIACGGLRLLGPGDGEIKRMYVRPAHRGRGVAQRLLGELEHQAADLGWTRLRLETGELQAAAIHLYRAAGYRQIDRYGPYAEVESSLCFERHLGDQSR